jgi:hypothetical protein
MYVGECQYLAHRFNDGHGSTQPRNCYEGGQATNCKMNNKVLQETRAGCTPVLWFFETDDRHRIEDGLIVELQPPWNGRW